MIKNINRYVFVTCVFIVAFGCTLSAQEVSFLAQAPKMVSAGEQFQLTYTLSESVDDFTPPDFGKFRYLGGPSTGSSTSISIVNGRTTRTSTYTFTYYLQAPPDGGTIILEAATANYKRNQIRSNTVQIEVVASGSQSSQPASGRISPAQKESSSTTTGADIYVRLETDKNSAYIGEQITVWIKIYTQVSITDIDPQFKGPDFVGFYQQNIELPSVISLEQERVGDDIYHTALIKKVILTPQKSGKITIDPFGLIVGIQKQTRRRPQSIFDQYFGSPYETSRLELKSNRVTFHIKPLPPDTPTGFNGAVGTFQIDGSANLTETKVNDAVTFRIHITGKGNIKLIDKISNNFPPTFEIFDPVRKVQIDANSQGRSGKVTFEYTAIPRHAGNFEIPPFSLVYFDPEAQTYKTASTPSFSILVHKGEGDSTSIVTSNLSKEEIELLGSDIRYIETKTNFITKGQFVFDSRWFYAIYIISICIAVIVLIFRREQIRRTANVVKFRNRKAGRIAAKRFKKTNALLKAHDKNGFYDELEQALWGFLADKLNIPYSELSKDRVIKEFDQLNIPSEISDEFFNIVDSCQLARYAPGDIQDEMSDLFHRASHIIGRLDQKL